MPSKHHRRIPVAAGVVGALCVFLAATALSFSQAAEQHVMQPRVPSDKLVEARGLTNPLPESADVRAKGKALYEGKGTCMNCHGGSGVGDGPLAASLDPSPRNFRHHGFWRHRTDGEVFWVIKYGVAGTAMIGFSDQLTDEEIWSIIQYERGFADGHGHRGGMGPRHDGGRSGPPGCCGGEPNP